MFDAAEFQRKRRAELKASGKCIQCGQEVQVEGRVRCRLCLGKSRAEQKARLSKKELDGLCKRCGERAPVDGRKYCQACLEQTRRTNARLRQRLVREGKCFACGKPCDTGTRCKECGKKNNAQMVERRQKWIKEGKCRECGKEAQVVDRTGQYHMPGGPKKGSYCRDCFFRMTAGYVLGSRKRSKELLEKLDEYGWRCAYTGELLVLGTNLSFDHIIPVCRCEERKHDIDNIEPVTLTINLMKRHLTKEEFLALIHKIVDCQKKKG